MVGCHVLTSGDVQVVSSCQLLQVDDGTYIVLLRLISRLGPDVCFVQDILRGSGERNFDPTGKDSTIQLRFLLQCLMRFILAC